MLRIRLICIGRLKGSERDLADRYATRFNNTASSAGFGKLTLVELAESKAQSPDERRTAEARALTQKLPEPAYCVALDERGRQHTSREFADLLAMRRDQGTRDIAFLIGAADGLSSELKNNAQAQLSLGPMTLPHGLARVVLLEQLYRALTILTNHPYHRG